MLPSWRQRRALGEMTLVPWLCRHPLLGYFIAAFGISWGGILLVLNHTSFNLVELRSVDTGLLFAGTFEELGWTGFATPRLLTRLRLFTAGFSLGIVWALWHLLVDFRQNFDTMGNAWLLEFAVLYVAALGWLFVLYPATSFEQGLVWQTAFAACLWIVVAVVYRRTRTGRH